MFSFQPKPGSSPLTFKEVFFERHARLREWALQLTNGEHADAEDLVQELYVRFAAMGPVREHIENAEDYLFSVLRYLHYARVRRARTSAIDDLSILDYDSAQRSLRAVDRNALLLIRDDLHRVCNFLCSRKNTSRAASVFILRYFLGYFPNEVMKVTQLTRGAVDKAIHAARREARLDLERPGALQPVTSVGRAKVRTALKGVDDSLGLFLALRNTIFASCTGACFEPALLEARYQQGGEAFASAELSHLVSCPACLDHVNHYVGLPLLEERSPMETIGRDTPQGPQAPGGSGSGSGDTPALVRAKGKKKDPAQLRKQMDRCLEEVNQHRPQRLSVAVDGDVRASHKVTGERSELTVELRPLERPMFVEVLSEQDFCLAFVLVQALEPESGLQQMQEIELSDSRTMKVMLSFTAERPMIRVAYHDPSLSLESEAAQEPAHPIALLRFAALETSSGPLSGIAGSKLRRWLSTFSVAGKRPVFAGAMLFAFCAIVAVVLWTKSLPGISADTLLARAEQSMASTPGPERPEVIFQEVKIKGFGRSKERVIYRDREKKRKPKEQPLNAADRQTKDRLEQAGVRWDDPLSAADFAAWRNTQGVKTDAVTRTGDDLLTLTTSTPPDSAVVRQSLTVRESDYHPVSRTVEFKEEGAVEIAEVSYQVLPFSAINPDWFEPLSFAAPAGPASARPSIHLSHALSELELDRAELSVRVTLNLLQADTGEQIHVTRLSTGIDVKGIVDTDLRKRQLLSRLAQLSNVRASIDSVEEMAAHPRPHAAADIAQAVPVYSVEAQPSPLELYLREKKLPLDDLAGISQTFLDRCLDVKQAQVHLSELRRRYQGADQLSIDLQSQLAELSRRYVNRVQGGLDADRRTLLSLGFELPEQAQPSLEPGLSDAALAQHVRRYQELCQELIGSGTGDARPAAAIATELLHSGDQIRSGATAIDTSLTSAHN